MSRIGKSPILIPSGVNVSITGNRVYAKGPKGNLEVLLHRLTFASLDGTTVRVSRQSETAEARAMHGLARSLINNMVTGVKDGFIKRLEIQGVGFKAVVQNKILNLSLGFSHPILYSIPDGIRVVVDENTKVTIEGADKETVGRVASEIRSFYPPEPYKGKGVRYAGEKVVRKEGKTVQ